MDLRGDYLPASWALGRAALAEGNEEVATKALSSLEIDYQRSPLVYQDTLMAFSRARQFDEVIALYEENRSVQLTRITSDTVTLAYLSAISNGKDYFLEQVERLNPDNLYVNYRLWRRAQMEGDMRAVASYSRRLTHFPIHAIDFTDERLLNYNTQAIRGLLNVGLWDHAKTLNVLSYLIWQAGDVASLESLLKDLIIRYPNETSWSFCLAELYHRLGDLEKAKEIYLQVSEMDPTFEEVYLRLGVVSDEKCQTVDCLKLAACWYERYNDLVPDDAWGREQLARICDLLEGLTCENLHCNDMSGKGIEHEINMDSEHDFSGSWRTGDNMGDRYLQSDEMSKLVQESSIGSDLLSGGQFEVWANDTPRNWEISDMATGDPWNEGLFAVGKDDFLAHTGGFSLRLQGFWVNTDKDKEPGRYGMATMVPVSVLDPGGAYLLSVDYKTSNLSDEGASIWLLDREVRLSQTDGKWSHLDYLYCMPAELAAMSETHLWVIPRIWDDGTVWFDGIGLRSLGKACLEIDKD